MLTIVIMQWPEQRWCCLTKKTSLIEKDKLLSWSSMIFSAKKNMQQGMEANSLRLENFSEIGY